MLAGYGAYGITFAPGYDLTIRPWLDRGGVWVVANLRGGGEYGEDWHRAGMLTKKQNVFDDFAACAEHLIQASYTNPSKLAILGGSNGGLLVGAATVQHPHLFRAVVAFVGLFDMLRDEATCVERQRSWDKRGSGVSYTSGVPVLVSLHPPLSLRQRSRRAIRVRMAL
jgi:prolyl oligopeptidase